MYFQLDHYLHLLISVMTLHDIHDLSIDLADAPGVHVYLILMFCLVPQLLNELPSGL